MLTLTGKEIEDLAKCAGFQIVELDYDDERECEIVIADCPKEGIQDDDGKATHFAHMAYFAEYPEEGCYPLGDEIKAPNAIAQGRGAFAASPGATGYTAGDTE